MTDLSKITCIEDLRVIAKRRVPRMFYDYCDSGSYTQSTYRANEADFQSIKLRQRVAVNMTGRSTRSTLVGQPVAMPVAIAPTGLTGMQHADGEILAARAAKTFGIPFTLSTMSICSIEDVAQHAGPGFWFQLYVMRDRDYIERLIDRAKAAGCTALQLTLDLQILGQRHRHGHRLADHGGGGAAAFHVDGHALAQLNGREVGLVGAVGALGPAAAVGVVVEHARHAAPGQQAQVFDAGDLAQVGHRL